MRIIGIAASLHAGSFVNRLLTAVGRELPPGARFACWQHLAEVPPYVPGPPPEPVAGLLRSLDEADGLVLTAPEHSLLPAELTHTLGWLSAFGVLAGKRAVVMSASARACGAMWAQAELYKELSAAGAVVMGGELVLSPICPHFDEKGRLVARYLRDQVLDMVRQLCPVSVGQPVFVDSALREPAFSA